MKHTLLVLILACQVTSLAGEEARIPSPSRANPKAAATLQDALQQLRQSARASDGPGGRAEVDEAAFTRLSRLFRSTPELRPRILEGLEDTANDPACKAVAPGILLRLGDLVASRDENKALGYYREAAEHPIKMSPWGYEQQTAIQRIAELYEKQGKYREAVRVLAAWQIREQSGTGAASRDVERQMKVLRLRRHYEADAVVYADLWAALERDRFPWTTGSGAEDMAMRIRLLYGPERITELKRDAAEAQKRLATSASAVEGASLASEHIALLLRAVQEQIRFVETVKDADPPKLAALLDEQIRRQAVIDQRALSLFWDDRRAEPSITNRFWREFLILEAIAAQGPKTAQPLIERMNRLYSDLYLVALGRAGGKVAVKHLLDRAAQAQTPDAAYNCYMGLLLTCDNDALEAVRKAAGQDADRTQAEGARWALQEYERPLRLVLDPKPTVRSGSRAVPLAGIPSLVAQRGGGSQRHILYLPDDVPTALAQDVFREFARAGAKHISVYAEDARGDWPKREIGIEVSANDPVRIVTEFAEEYPESLRRYLGNDVRNTLLVAKTSLPDVGAVLTPLLELSARKHVRVVEVGSQDGIPAERYLQVLDKLDKLGVTVVSFYGVYVE